MKFQDSLYSIRKMAGQFRASCVGEREGEDCKFSRRESARHSFTLRTGSTLPGPKRETFDLPGPGGAPPFRRE